jgi:hypothetical protein
MLGIVRSNGARQPGQAFIVAEIGKLGWNNRRRGPYAISLDGVWHRIYLHEAPGIGKAQRQMSRFHDHTVCCPSDWPARELVENAPARHLRMPRKPLRERRFPFRTKACADRVISVYASAERFVIRCPAREHLCRLFLGSSAVEHSTVNRMVAGSNPARGASRLFRPHSRLFAPLIKFVNRPCKVSTCWCRWGPRGLPVDRTIRQRLRANNSTAR